MTALLSRHEDNPTLLNAVPALPGTEPRSTSVTQPPQLLSTAKQQCRVAHINHSMHYQPTNCDISRKSMNISTASAYMRWAMTNHFAQVRMLTR